MKDRPGSPNETNQGVKTMGKNQHVVPHGAKWAMRGEGNERVTPLHGTQAETIESARDVARNQQPELLIHGRNCSWHDGESYE